MPCACLHAYMFMIVHGTMTSVTRLCYAWVRDMDTWTGYGTLISLSLVGGNSLFEYMFGLPCFSFSFLIIVHALYMHAQTCIN